MAEAVHRVRNVFEGEDRVSDDIRRIERGLGDLENKTQGFGDVLRGPAGMLAGMYLTEEALQRLIEGYHELATTMAEEGVVAAQQYIESTNNLQSALSGLGEALVEATGGPIAVLINALADWWRFGGLVWDITGNMTEALKTLAREGIGPAREQFRGMTEESLGAYQAQRLGFEPTVGPDPREEDEATRATLEAISRMREEYESINGQVELLSGRIQGDLLPSMELVGIVGVESLEMVGLSAEETGISLRNAAIDARDGFEGDLLPAIDAVIDRLITASEAGDVLGDVLRGAAQGFIFGGPVGAVVGGAVPLIGSFGRDDDVPRG